MSLDLSPTAATPEPRDRATELGRAAIAVLHERYGRAATDVFLASLLAPTLPHTPERRAQDEAWRSFARRLIAAGAPRAAEPAP
jgi:hypothetical protein